MTKEEIITMAEGAGFFVKENEAYSPSTQEDHELTPHLEAFAKLVAEHERKNFCAQLAQLHDSYSLASHTTTLRGQL